MIYHLSGLIQYTSPLSYPILSYPILYFANCPSFIPSFFYAWSLVLDFLFFGIEL